MSEPSLAAISFAAISFAAISFAAIYYDGIESRPHRVTVRIAAGRVTISGAAERVYELSATQVSERLAKAPRLITFADGTYLEVADHAQLERALSAAGFRESWVVRWQNHWPSALGALMAAVAVVGLGYVYGLPYFARLAATWVPPQLEARIGAESVAWLDANLLAPTRLPEQQRERLLEKFARLAPQDGRTYRIEFRASRLGANAVALPGGRIIVTDELVRLASNDEAVLGVLAHELGHVQERHLLRRLIASAVVAAAVTLLAGDASGVLTALPATLADLRYSRDMEREADRYAIDLLLANHLPLEPLAQLFEAMQSAHRDRRSAGGTHSEGEEGARNGSAGSDWLQYLSTHPDTAERIREIRAAAASPR